MNSATKKHLITAFKFAVSIAILAYLFYVACKDPNFLTFFSRPKHWGWITLGLFGALFANVISFIRWRIMVRALGLPFSYLDAIRIGFIGLFFNTTTIGVIGGDALRAFYVTRQIEERRSEAILSVVADRIIGLLTMFTVASTMFLFLDTSNVTTATSEELKSLNIICIAVLVLTILGFLGIFTIFCAPWITKSKWYLSLSDLPKVGGIIEKLTSVVLAYRSKPGTVGICFLLSVLVNLCFVVSIYSMATGLATNYPTFADHFVIEPIAMVANAIPIPGGFGGMEWAMRFLYRSFDADSGLLVAFAFRAALLLVTAIGAVFWFFNKKKVSEAMESDNSVGSN